MSRTVNQDQQEQRRRELARAVYRVVDRSGIEGASMREIAREAGCTTGALTHHFTGRDDLLEYALGLAIDESMERVVAAARTGSLLDALSELLPLDEHRRAEGAAWLVSIGAARRDARLAGSLSRRYAAAHRLLAGALAERLATADGSPAPDAREIALLVDEVLTATDGIAAYALADPERYPPRRQRALVARVLRRTGLEDPGPEDDGPGTAAGEDAGR